MYRLLGPFLVAFFLIAFGSDRMASASFCGLTRHCCCRQACCVATCQPQCGTCTVMKTCCETIYEEEQRTFYKTVYEDVVDKVPVDAVRYVEEIQYRCQPCTIWQP